MEHLNFDDGIKYLAINGDENRVIAVNPTDTGIISRYHEILPKFEELTEKYKNFKSDNMNDSEIAEINAELDRQAREFIDYIIGSPVADIAFRKTNCLSVSGGSTIFENFLTAYINYMTPTIQKEYEKSKKRIEKYTKQVRK